MARAGGHINVAIRSGSLLSRNFGKALPRTRISERMIHVGFTVQDRAAADRLYRDILGFRLQWYGGMTDERTDWVSMRVPEGTDWLEYMLNQPHPSPKTVGVMNHLALGVPSTEQGYRTVVERGMSQPDKPKIGRDGKWQLNLYDPNLTRAELMEPAPVQLPCDSGSVRSGFAPLPCISTWPARGVSLCPEWPRWGSRISHRGTPMDTDFCRKRVVVSGSDVWQPRRQSNLRPET